MTGTEVETPEASAPETPAASTTTTPAVPVTLTKPELIAWMRGEDLDEQDIADEIDYATAMRVMTAETAADVLTPDTPIKFETLIDETFVVLAVGWWKSDKYDKTMQRVAAITFADREGESHLTNTGSSKVILQLRRAELDGWLPWQVTLQAVETNTGNTMLQLIAPEEPF